MPQKRVAMKRIHLLESALVELLAHASLEDDACLCYAPPLTLGLFALVSGERLQVGIETGVVMVGPVKLTIAPDQPARLLTGQMRRLIEKQRVHGREAVARGVGLDVSQQPARNELAVQIGTHQQPRAGCRGEGHCDRQFGVVAAAEARVGLRPGEVEYKLAVGVGFAECRYRGRKSLAVLQREIARIPAGGDADAAGVFESCKELVT